MNPSSDKSIGLRFESDQSLYAYGRCSGGTHLEIRCEKVTDCDDGDEECDGCGHDGETQPRSIGSFAFLQ